MNSTKNRPKVIAPFINDWCVWDIEEAHWTEDVKSAILHAYELGHQHATDEIKDFVSKNKNPGVSCYDDNWPEIEDAT